MNRKLKYHNRQNIPVKKWLPVAHSTPDISHRKKKISTIYPRDCLRGLPVNDKRYTVRFCWQIGMDAVEYGELKSIKVKIVLFSLSILSII